MKLRYKKNTKLSYAGNQYNKGDILDVETIGNLPEDWFEVIEPDEVIEEEVKVYKGKKKHKEVIEDGYS